MKPAVLRPAAPPRRHISEVVARMPKNSTATMDADFTCDVEAAIEGHREPLEPRAWDRCWIPRLLLEPSGWGNHISNAGSDRSAKSKIRRSLSRVSRFWSSYAESLAPMRLSVTSGGNSF
jgi:hypothetical protein